MRRELEATIEEGRDWRWGDNRPPWLQPIWKPALELGLWLGLIRISE